MRSRLTYANVVTTLSLVLLVAGGAALALPGKNSVQANDLRKNSVRAKAIAANAVRSAEIQDGVVGTGEVAEAGLAYADLGSNSVVTRIRNTAVVSSAGATQASPAVVPLSGDAWTQPGDETEVFFGEMTVTQSGVCGAGELTLELLIDGQLIDTAWDQGFDQNVAGTFTRHTLTRRPFLFEPGEAKARTATLRIYDDCANAGTFFTLDNWQAIAVGMR